MKKFCSFALVGALLLAGCATKTGTGASVGTLGGAGAGAIIGQAIGGNTKATLLGTAIGAVVGGLAGTGVGYMMDNQDREMREALAESDAISVQRNGEMLALLFKSDMTFDTNSSSIRSGLLSELSRVAQVMQRYPQTSIQIIGHTDSTGSAAYNQTLSLQRANSVKNQLMYDGVPEQRMTAMGFGKDRPIADNSTESGRAQNRRVEIRITPNQQQQQQYSY